MLYDILKGILKLLQGHEKKYVYFIVSDEGEGIPDADIERLFQPFTQGDKARGTEGSGLGLAIIKRIVDTHAVGLNYLINPHRWFTSKSLFTKDVLIVVIPYMVLVNSENHKKTTNNYLLVVFLFASVITVEVQLQLMLYHCLCQ